MSLIQNKDVLAVTDMRKVALEIAEAGLEAIKTERVIENNVRLVGEELFIQDQKIDLQSIERLFIVGIGKCALDASISLEAILGERISDGVAIDVREDAANRLTRIRAFSGTHPLPTEVNVVETKALLDLLHSATERDVVIAVVSGGGSTLLCQPKTHTCEDEADLFAHLTSQGASIQELNIVRKHLSVARGGNLAVACKGKLFALIFSDVPGDDISFIASGPTVFDITTVSDADTVLKKYHADSIGFSNVNLLETPKDESLFAHTKNILVLTNKTALSAMQAKATELGFHVEIRDTHIKGDAETVARDITTTLHAAPVRSVFLYGGETTVMIRGTGTGGRNQHLALAALSDIRDGELLFTLASDGHDNTDYAGAIVDTETAKHAQEKKLDPNAYVQNNDAYTFFHTQGGTDAVITGYTGSNIADLVIAIKE